MRVTHAYGSSGPRGFRGNGVVTGAKVTTADPRKPFREIGIGFGLKGKATEDEGDRLLEQAKRDGEPRLVS